MKMTGRRFRISPPFPEEELRHPTVAMLMNAYEYYRKKFNIQCIEELILNSVNPQKWIILGGRFLVLVSHPAEISFLRKNICRSSSRFPVSTILDNVAAGYLTDLRIHICGYYRPKFTREWYSFYMDNKVDLHAYPFWAERYLAAISDRVDIYKSFTGNPYLVGQHGNSIQAILSPIRFADLSQKWDMYDILPKSVATRRRRLKLMATLGE